MNLDRLRLLSFYDDRRTWLTETDHRGAHVSAITGLLGEDIVIGLLLHLWRSLGHTAVVGSYRCNQGKSGSRLDAWIVQDSIKLYQVEVKNWSAHSLGGKDLSPDASEQERSAVARSRWKHYFENQTGLASEVSKVLTPMKVPEVFAALPVSKLLCFWSYVVNAKAEPLSVVTVNSEQLHVFSASAYLRSLTSDSLLLEMPRANARLKLVDTLRHTKDE